jgi:hypothetical protein
MKIVRFLIWIGKSAIPIANAVAGAMKLTDSIHLATDAARFGVLRRRFLRPRTMSRLPTIKLIPRPIVEAILTAPTTPTNKMSHATPIAAHTVK